MPDLRAAPAAASTATETTEALEIKDLNPAGSGLYLAWHKCGLLQWVARTVRDGVEVLLPLGAAWPDDQPATMTGAQARARIEDLREALRSSDIPLPPSWPSPFPRRAGFDPLAA